MYWIRNAWRPRNCGAVERDSGSLQVGIDGVGLCNAIEETTEADMRRLATDVFAPSKRVAVVIEPAE